jgi:hypothetical protein
VGLVGFQQNQLTDNHWHEQINTLVDIGGSLGVSRIHDLALNYVVEEQYKSMFEQKPMMEDAKERYLAYNILMTKWEST